jgi:hypothetical protein
VTAAATTEAPMATETATVRATKAAQKQGNLPKEREAGENWWIDDNAIVRAMGFWMNTQPKSYG